jgi:hypothetical protein
MKSMTDGRWFNRDFNPEDFYSDVEELFGNLVLRMEELTIR